MPLQNFNPQPPLQTPAPQYDNPIYGRSVTYNVDNQVWSIPIYNPTLNLENLERQLEELNLNIKKIMAQLNIT